MTIAQKKVYRAGITREDRETFTFYSAPPDVRGANYIAPGVASSHNWDAGPRVLSTEFVPVIVGSPWLKTGTE